MCLHIFISDKMTAKFIEKKKDSIEMEFDDKVLPNLMRTDLIEHGVDSYCYDPHPLLPGYRLHVDAKDAMKEIKDSVKRVEKDWKDFGKAVTKTAATKKKSASKK